MSHHIEDILAHWQRTPNDEWVLAVITKVQGSAYRKTGAMMLFHPLGCSIGLLSGGCLEADLRRHAQMAIERQQAVFVQYDASDETDASYQLGCGGIVDIMLVPLKPENDHLCFHQLAAQLAHNGRCIYQISLPQKNTLLANVSASVKPYEEREMSPDRAVFIETEVLMLSLRSRYRLAIFGGGLDAQPMVAMALNLGWQVDLIDERISYARSHDFPGANIYRESVNTLPKTFGHHLDAIIVMQHNLALDAKALVLAHQIDKDGKLSYLALLGPAHRRDRLLQKSELSIDDFHCFFSAPAGFALGGELPESIALSILAQCHGVLHDAQQIPLDKVML